MTIKYDFVEVVKAGPQLEDSTVIKISVMII